MRELTELQVEGITVSGIDMAIIAIYLVFILVAGVYLSRAASKNMDSYFLGGRRLPWWLLGLSGTACYFDVAGVMWTITMFYVMGQQFIWPQFMWGNVVMLACFAAFMGKWLRRSKVLTGAEWMVVRFGTGPGGEFARTAYAFMAMNAAKQANITTLPHMNCGQRNCLPTEPRPRSCAKPRAASRSAGGGGRTIAHFPRHATSLKALSRHSSVGKTAAAPDTWDLSG